MNEYTMIHLAAERGRQLRAEAARQRLAQDARRQRPAGPGQPRQVRPLILGRLLRRVAV
jgi:hypothetical protein